MNLRDDTKGFEMSTFYESNPKPGHETYGHLYFSDARIEAMRAAILARDPEAEDDVCMAGEPAFGGWCGNAGCVCGGWPTDASEETEAVA